MWPSGLTRPASGGRLEVGDHPSDGVLGEVRHDVGDRVPEPRVRGDQVVTGVDRHHVRRLVAEDVALGRELPGALGVGVVEPPAGERVEDADAVDAGGDHDEDADREDGSGSAGDERAPAVDHEGSSSAGAG
ncbi:hypothetical protein [Nocardioides sp. TF02-7]|uniref:hypothetical protein n=1 Tax=Nocardioides sp. TF02-7 TaxID=2917724 RepID=UPI001F06F2F7|nr:hypothetical protein [Nocardioides sp. TF02-7]UMG94473.1 hypothetical protein MF408_11140 [Nocardioides sp. TF02-7]